MRSSDFVNHLYDYRPNWTPLSPVTITNRSLAFSFNFRGPTRGCLEGGRHLKERFSCVHNNYGENKQVFFFIVLGGACIRQGVFIREGCCRRGIY